MKETPLEEKDIAKPQDSTLAQQIARGMILKEVDTFTTDDTEISDIDTHKMKIQLKDQVPA